MKAIRQGLRDDPHSQREEWLLYRSRDDAQPLKDQALMYLFVQN